MSHNVENMFSVREVPWHKLGKIVSEAPNAQDAIKLAGLDWEVKRQQIHIDISQEQGRPHFVSVPKKQALVRSTDNRVLAVIGSGYTPLQNKDAFGFFDKFILSGDASFETAGSLRGGEIVWILAKLNRVPIEVGKGDQVSKYLLLSNSHNGTMAVRTGFTPVRVVCNNTLTMSHESRNSKLIRIHHSSKVKENVDNLAEIVNAMDAKFEATAEQYKFLASRKINKKDLNNYIDIIFELRPEGTEREQMRAAKMREIISGLFENGAGAHLKSAKGTAWGAYNAVTEYLTHMGGKDESVRLHANWFGGLNKKNDEALSEITRIVK